MVSMLEKEHIIAGSGYGRWLVLPAALAIHLCIGMAYGFSVLWLPLSRAVGISEPIPCPEDVSFFETLFVTACDWKISMLGWMYTLFFFFLGSAAAVWGDWVEHEGPSKAGVAAPLCWCGGQCSGPSVYTRIKFGCRDWDLESLVVSDSGLGTYRQYQL